HQEVHESAEWCDHRRYRPTPERLRHPRPGCALGADGAAASAVAGRLYEPDTDGHPDFSLRTMTLMTTMLRSLLAGAVAVGVAITGGIPDGLISAATL